MNIKMLRTSCVAAGLLVPITFTISGANGSSQIAEESQDQVRGHFSGLMAKITLPDGATRTVRLEGVGCTQSICSRVAIKSKTEHDSLMTTSFEAIAAIKDTTQHDALFVLKDGTQQRMSLLTDFRVLYLTKGTRAAERLDLAKVKLIEFLGPQR